MRCSIPSSSRAEQTFRDEIAAGGRGLVGLGGLCGGVSGSLPPFVVVSAGVMGLGGTRGPGGVTVAPARSVGLEENQPRSIARNAPPANTSRSTAALIAQGVRLQRGGVGAIAPSPGAEHTTAGGGVALRADRATDPAAVADPPKMARGGTSWAAANLVGTWTTAPHEHLPFRPACSSRTLSNLAQLGQVNVIIMTSCQRSTRSGDLQLL